MTWTNMLRKKSMPIKDPVESRFETMMGLVKDLTPKDYRRLKKAMDSGYEAYNIVRDIKTEDDVIEKSELKLIEEENDNNKKSTVQR